MNRVLKLVPAAALLALAGSPCLAQSPDDDNPSIQTHVITLAPGGGGTSSVSSMWSLSCSQDGRNIKLEGKNGVISAEVDGKAVPADRIVHEGNTVKLKDDKGEVIYQTEVPGTESGNASISINSRGWGSPSVWQFGPGGTITPRSVNTLHINAEPPTVMIGVQLLEPDSSLRGHLGLKEGESTLISAIYDGLPASAAGIEPYDIVVAVNGKSPAPPDAVRKALHTAEAGKTISLDVIHRGQKKTVTITPEKYDADKLDKAKINAIAAATNTPSANVLSGIDPGMVNVGPSPWIVGIPKGGKAIPMVPGTPGMPGFDAQAMAEQMRQMAEQAQQQAQAARQQAEEMRRQIEAQLHGQFGNAAPGAPGNMQQQMNDLMKRMESMQKMLEEKQQQEKPKTDEKPEGRS
jgi:hypothetical protein